MEFFSLINEILYIIALLKAQTVGNSRQRLFLLYNCLNLADLYLVVTYPVKFGDGLYNRHTVGIYTG